MCFFLIVGANWAAVLIEVYFELMVWKRGDREKEKVCFEADLLTGDWFKDLKTDDKGNFLFERGDVTMLVKANRTKVYITQEN